MIHESQKNDVGCVCVFAEAFSASGVLSEFFGSGRE
jgi:hypothetical protein